jgi:hypothetical protein
LTVQKQWDKTVKKLVAPKGAVKFMGKLFFSGRQHQQDFRLQKVYIDMKRSEKVCEEERGKSNLREKRISG